MNKPGANREQIEKEYQDAKAKLADATQAAADWDQRTGVAPLREQCERADDATEQSGLQMAMMEPATLAGAAAMINYAWPEVANGATGEDDWPLVALKMVAATLTRMSERTA